MDFDAIIVGGGPAGLAAGSMLARARYRVLLLDKESFGGRVSNVEWIEDHPQPGERTRGAMLASEMVNQAAQSGLRMELGEVCELESYSGCNSVTCTDGRAYTAAVVVVASGLRAKKLGVPGEERLQGKGVIHCALCDAGLYAGRTVVVCGAGDAGLIEAMTLARHAGKVIVIEAQESPSGAPALVQRARAQTGVDLRCGRKVVAVRGEDGVTGVDVLDVVTGHRETIQADGVLAQVGFEPMTEFAAGLLALDDRGYVCVNVSLETELAGILAAGDIRSGSPRGIAAAIADGNKAAAAAQRFLERSRASS